LLGAFWAGSPSKISKAVNSFNPRLFIGISTCLVIYEE
jgi:hypothetical protein